MPWLSRAAAEHPNRPAIRTTGGEITYRELDAAAGAAARALGTACGERVAIALPAGIDFAIALHACLRSGAVAVPVDPRLTADERVRVLTGAAAVIDRPLAVTGSPVPPRELELDAPATVIHSSGSAGGPKPITLTRGNWLWSALGAATALGLGGGERWLCALPLAHVGGLSILMRSAIYGATAIVHERFNTAQVLAALDEATLVSVVPTTLGRLLDAGLERPGRLRCALVGGAPMAPEMGERARLAGLALSRTYGLTEACSQVTTQTPGDTRADAGPPLFCTRVRIAPDGEILVAGPTVAPGCGPWLRTGDLGSLDGEGRLTVTGRRSELIISGGENIAPSEVEAVLAAHPAVSEAAVLGVADPTWGEALRALVVARAPVTEAELRDHCAARLAPFKIPKKFVLRTDPLPRTTSGKLLRRELR